MCISIIQQRWYFYHENISYDRKFITNLFTFCTWLLSAQDPTHIYWHSFKSSSNIGFLYLTRVLRMIQHTLILWKFEQHRFFVPDSWALRIHDPTHTYRYSNLKFDHHRLFVPDSWVLRIQHILIDILWKFEH